MKVGHPRMARSSPPGMDAVHSCYGRRFSFATYKTVALVITFWCYCLFHATRKPPSVVKRYVGSRGTAWLSRPKQDCSQPVRMARNSRAAP